MAGKTGRDPQGGWFELRFYEGYKGKETPRSVVIAGREFPIDRIFERKRIRDLQTGKNFEAFTCEMAGKKVRLIIHDSGAFEIWYR